MILSYGYVIRTRRIETGLDSLAVGLRTTPTLGEIHRRTNEDKYGKKRIFVDGARGCIDAFRPAGVSTELPGNT